MSSTPQKAIDGATQNHQRSWRLALALFLLLLTCLWISRTRPTFAQPAATPAIDYPQLVDITASTGIHFDHHSSPEQKFIVESMSGGVALIDYDRDGWPDIYFTNAQTVDMARQGIKARSALFHNTHDGTFTDVTDKAGVGYPCWATASFANTPATTGRLPSTRPREPSSASR